MLLFVKIPSLIRIFFQKVAFFLALNLVSSIGCLAVGRNLELNRRIFPTLERVLSCMPQLYNYNYMTNLYGATTVLDGSATQAEHENLANEKVSARQPWYIGLPKMRSSAKFRENLNL